MRKNDVRKWLHAVLDLLPVIIIPVFMIYSHRHTIDNYSITIHKDVTENVEFNQLIKNSMFNNTSNWSTSANVTFSVNDNIATLVKSSSSGSGGIIYENMELNSEHQYYFRSYAKSNDGTSAIIGFLDGTNSTASNAYVYTTSSDFVLIETITSPVNDADRFALRCGSSSSLVGSSVSFKYPNLFDLTQMFGIGNEPTIEEFKVYFPNDVYEYDTGSIKTIVVGNDDVVYDDTDIGSQMFYCLYNSVDKYFNMGNVFNLNGVYDWFNLNIFNGNSPLAVYVVWQIVLYEFVMDLLFLLYGLFMFFIDSCTNLMERFNCQLRGR